MATRILPPSPFDAAALGLGPVAAFIGMLAASWILPTGPLTVLLAAVLLLYLVMSPAAANGAAIRLALPFALMTIWALALSSGNAGYDIGKDVWYAGKLCLCLMLGFLLGVRSVESRRALDALTLLAGVMALVSIILWFVVGGQVGELTSEESTRLPLIGVVAIVPLLDRSRHESGIRRVQAAALLALILIAVVVSNSRITIIASATMILAWAGLFSRTRRALLGGVVVGILLALLWQVLPEYAGGELTVAVKLRRSLEEVLLTDNFDTTQMILNWRGFEAYNAQLMFDRASALKKLFGNGLGATVDLGQEVILSDEASFRYLPILHNGFYYILIKYGVIGVMIYILSVLRFGLLGKLASNNMSAEDRMLRGLIVIILLATTVITGLYNKTELNGLAILLAWLIGFAQRRRYEETVHSAAALSRARGSGV
ncbi:hypothetical protein [uncultured Sphingomonas sp.]|uniref:hypothetical protein n=1 Tax=uncultured Sphingomonas sp. TaxID=158754 RepID=UPI0035C98764